MAANGFFVRRKLLSKKIQAEFISDFQRGWYRERLELLSDVLKENPSLLYARDNEGYTPLHVAAEWGDVEVVQILIERGAEVNLPNSFGDTPLHLVVQAPRHRCVSPAETILLLLNHGADVNRVNQSHQTPTDYDWRRRLQDAENERKYAILNELWEIPDLATQQKNTNYFQWFPRETKEELQEMLSSSRVHISL